MLKRHLAPETLERLLRNELLPEQKEELDSLFAELLALDTPEARLYKALDRIEAVIQHNEAPLDTWIELERTLNLEYGTEDCARFPLLRELREIAAEDTRRKLADGK